MLWKHWVCRLGKSNLVPGRENTLGQTETVGWSRQLKLLECRNTRVGWQNLVLRQSLSSLLCRVERGTGTCLAGELGISHLFPALVAALEVPHIYPCRNSPFVSAPSSYPWSFAQIQVWLHFPFTPIMICHFLLCGVFSLKHNPGTITLQYVGIIIHYFQFTTRKRLGCHACPVSPHSPMSQLPFESSNTCTVTLCTNPPKINKTISFPSGIISQKRDQTKELEKEASGSSAGTSKDSEEKTIIKRL